MNHRRSSRIVLSLTVIVFTLWMALITHQLTHAAPSSGLRLDTSNNLLLETLAMIPDTADSRPSRYFGVRYVDLRAIELAGGFTRPASFGVMTGSAKTQWLNAMTRARALGLDEWADALTHQIDRNTDMPRLVGFDWFAIDRVVGYGAPPRAGLILTGTFDTKKMAQALSARKFQETTIAGIKVWNRFADGQNNPNAREPRDPFGGATGSAARIAMFPNYLGNARFWDMANQIIATGQKSQKSLADAPDYRALADAITDPNMNRGFLLQAVFIPGSIFDSANILDIRMLPDLPDLSDYGELPSYSLAVLADRQEDTMQVHLVAIAYADAATAQQASTELYRRISEFDIAQMYERFEVKIDPPRLYKDESGQVVLIVSVRYPLKADPSTGKMPLPGVLYNRWLSMVYFYPLAPKLIHQP